jgi:hypothetical protein
MAAPFGPAHPARYTPLAQVTAFASETTAIMKIAAPIAIKIDFIFLSRIFQCLEHGDNTRKGILPTLSHFKAFASCPN